MYSAAREVGNTFLQGLASMLFKQGKTQSADTLTRSAQGLIGTRARAEVGRQAPMPEFGMPPRAGVMPQAERVRQGLRSGQSTGLIGTRDAVPNVARQAPVPEFGNPPALNQIPEAMRVALGRSAAPTVPGPNAAVADSLQDSAPDLANLIRANDALEAGPSASQFNYQPGIPFRFPAGSRSLADTVSTRGRTTPAGTSVGGRPYTPESMASPRNVETGRMAGAPRQADAPDAPARMPQGQREIDMRSNPELLMAQAYRTAPGVTPAAGSAADVGRSNVMNRMSGMGVQQGSINDLLKGMSREDLAAMAVGGGLVATPVIAQMLGVRGPEEERAMLDVEAQPNVTTVVSPSTPPLSPPGGDVQPSNIAGGLDPVNPQLTLTGDQNAALRQQQSNVIAAVSQSDPIAAQIVNAVAPRDPSYYTPERGGIEQYYKDRENYVRGMDEGDLQSMVADIQATAANDQQQAALGEWAASNPGLAYELIRKATMTNPGQNQQSGQQVTSQALGSSLGTNNAANAEGQGQAAASQVRAEGYANSPLEQAARIQANNEIISAAAPITYNRLQRTQDFAREAALRQQMGIG